MEITEKCLYLEFFFPSDFCMMIISTEHTGFSFQGYRKGEIVKAAHELEVYSSEWESAEHLLLLMCYKLW